MTTNTEKAFVLSEHLDTNAVRGNTQTTERTFGTVNSYEEVYFKALDYVEKKLDDESVNETTKKNWLNIKHNAIMGDKNAEAMLTTDLENYLLRQGIKNIDYPSFYNSLASALFHDIYMFGALKKWDLYPDSPSAKIIGKEIWFKINGQFERQEETLRTESHIDELIKNLEIANRGVKVNEANPRVEIPMKDGSRVTIIVPPASYEKTIVFRKFNVKEYSFDYLAKRNTIDENDVEFFDTMFKLKLNTIIAGHVESGKSTLLKTGFAARDPKEVAINIESVPESFFKRDFPDRCVHDLYTLGANVEDVLRTVLRMDHDYIIYQEIRGFEAEGAMQSTQRGTRGALMTYHITNPEMTAPQLAQHIVDEYPNRSLEAEIQKVYQQLDIGIIMKKVGNNRKVVDAVYELCFDYQTKEKWINYLIKFNTRENKWEYNPAISKMLIERMEEVSIPLTQQLIDILNSRSVVSPLTSNASIKY